MIRATLNWLSRDRKCIKNGMESYRIVYFSKKTFCEEEIWEFPVIRPESTPEDSPTAAPLRIWWSWGIPKEFSSSNYRREEDREDFWKSRIPTTSCSGSSPIATQGALGPRNVGNRSVSRFCRSRRWDPAGKSAKFFGGYRGGIWIVFCLIN